MDEYTDWWMDGQMDGIFVQNSHNAIIFLRLFCERLLKTVRGVLHRTTGPEYETLFLLQKLLTFDLKDSKKVKKHNHRSLAVQHQIVFSPNVI